MKHFTPVGTYFGVSAHFVLTQFGNRVGSTVFSVAVSITDVPLETDAPTCVRTDPGVMSQQFGRCASGDLPFAVGTHDTLVLRVNVVPPGVVQVSVIVAVCVVAGPNPVCLSATQFDTACVLRLEFAQRPAKTNTHVFPAGGAGTLLHVYPACCGLQPCPCAAASYADFHPAGLFAFRSIIVLFTRHVGRSPSIVNSFVPSFSA